jgi:hypothetical protein
MGWIVPQPNLPARIFLLRLLTADAIERLSGFRMSRRLTVFCAIDKKLTFATPRVLYGHGQAPQP